MGNDYFNDDYECYECGAKMKKADEEVLVCPVCGPSVVIVDSLAGGEGYVQLYGGHSRFDEATDWHDNEEFPGEKYEDVYGNNE